MNALAAIAISVLMHVSWNLMARHQPPKTFALWWALLAHLVMLAPWGMTTLLNELTWTPSMVGLMIVSATANALYFFSLRQAYLHAPVALVYPLVRSSPILIALWSHWIFAEALSSTAWAGLVVSALGLVLLALTARHGSDRKALPWAALAMLATSLYSLSDKAATAHIHSFGGLVGFISVGYCAAWITLTLDMKRREGLWIPRQRLRWPLMLIGGLSIGLAYALVIHAMRTHSAAVVVTFTNAGIVIATLVSVLIFKETQRWPTRIGAALVICAGIGVMAAAR
jgi:phosphonate utilization associated putative membrane protein